MALYTQDSIERLKQALDIVEIVGARTELRRVGARYTGLCPFHEERTPSFSVNPELNLYYCFGCQEKGDAIGFVQTTEALDFREAVELLADRYGVELKKDSEDPQEEERRRLQDRLLGLLERTTEFYSRYFWDSNEAAPSREYMKGRGLGEEVLRTFRVGYSPSAWDTLLIAARRLGYTEEELAGTGLGVRGRQGNKFYDRFRGRIMFPLADQRGKVVGFGARETKKQEGMPKYLNTNENLIFHKSRQLYGLHLARASAARAGRILVVEGYTDVLALHQAGVPETVAIMGTSLTEEQMTQLAQAAPTVFLALDADGPGQEAMLKASRMAGTRDVDLRVIVLPEGKDPAELVAGGGVDAFAPMFEKAMSVAEFEVRRELAKGDLGSARGRDQVLESVRPLIALVPERTAARDELVRQVADRLDVPTSYVVGDGKAPPPRPRREAPAPEGDPGPAVPSPVDALLRAERSFLAMCVSQAVAAQPYLEKLTDEHLSTGGLRRLREHLVTHLSDPLTDLPADDPEVVALAGEIVMLADEEPTGEGALRLGFLQLDLRRLDRALRSARASRDFDVQRELYKEREQARAEMDQVMGEAL